MGLHLYTVTIPSSKDEFEDKAYAAMKARKALQLTAQVEQDDLSRRRKLPAPREFSIHITETSHPKGSFIVEGWEGPEPSGKRVIVTATCAGPITIQVYE